MIYGWVQALHCTPDYILHQISYENLVLYSSAAPSYDSADKEDEWDDSIDANNPNNFNNDTDDEEEIFI